MVLWSSDLAWAKIKPLGSSSIRLSAGMVTSTTIFSLFLFTCSHACSLGPEAEPDNIPSVSHRKFRTVSLIPSLGKQFLFLPSLQLLRLSPFIGLLSCERCPSRALNLALCVASRNIEVHLFKNALVFRVPKIGPSPHNSAIHVECQTKTIQMIPHNL